MSSAQSAGPGPFRRIVLATDGSADAARATKVAIDLAKRFSADLLVVSAVPYALGLSAEMDNAVGSVQALAQFQEVARVEARKVLKDARDLAKAQGVPAREVVLEQTASAVEMIAKFAKQERADLIVVGTRGLSGFRKLLVGSVSSGLVSHAPCSVLVVR